MEINNYSNFVTVENRSKQIIGFIAYIKKGYYAIAKPSNEDLGEFETLEESVDAVKKFTEAGCSHECHELIDAGGDAETGPITLTECVNCCKIFTQFGM